MTEPTVDPVSDPSTDPVLARRAKLASWARAGKRIGYGLFAVAIVTFFTGTIIGVTPAIATIVTTSLAAGSIILVPVIILGYGVRGAERDERIGRAPGRGALRGSHAPVRKKPEVES